MPQTPYAYSIASDFPVTGLNVDGLKEEIQQSPIITALERIDVVGDTCTIIFKDALSTGDKTLLDNDTVGPAGGLIAAHDGQPPANIIPEGVHLVTAKGTPVQETGDRPIFVPARFPKGVDPYITGVADKIDNPVARGGGDKLHFFWSVAPLSAEDQTKSFFFLDRVRVVAGGVVWKGAGMAASDCDLLNMWLDAPASVIAANGGSTGNANKSVVPGGNIIVPAAGDGSWDIDLTPDLHSESPVPVPNLTQTGFWDWDEPDEGLGTFTPNFTQTGGYDLFDFEIPLVVWAKNIPIIGDGNQYIDPNSIARPIAPQWKWNVQVHNGALSILSVGVYLHTARLKTT